MVSYTLVSYILSHHTNLFIIHHQHHQHIWHLWNTNPMNNQMQCEGQEGGSNSENGHRAQDAPCFFWLSYLTLLPQPPPLSHLWEQPLWGLILAIATFPYPSVCKNKHNLQMQPLPLSSRMYVLLGFTRFLVLRAIPGVCWGVRFNHQ